MDRMLQVEALLDKAKKNGGESFLEKIRDEALAATLAGDWEMTSNAFDGGSGTGARKFKAQDILEISQQALKLWRGGSTESVYLDFATSGRTVQT